MISIIFLILATLGVASALGTVLARDLVHAALFLVSFFFLVACLFLLLDAEFLAAVQVLVYIGAVAILIVFGIMLTRDVHGTSSTSARRSVAIPAGLVGLGLAGLLVAAIARESGVDGRAPWRSVEARPSVDPDREGRVTRQAEAVGNMGQALGIELMGRYALPFEVAGLLLTAVLVGSIAMARRDDDDSADREAVDRRRQAEPAEGPIRRRHRAVPSRADAVTPRPEEPR